jgi:AhpD family alkylhydroperoxidase
MSGEQPMENTRQLRVDMRALAPDAYRAMAAFDRSIELEPALRELVRIRVSQLNGCAFCIDMHTRAARTAGESERRLYALAAWRESPLFDPRERSALRLAEAITAISSAGVSDDLYAQAAEHFPPVELANLILAITAINSWNRIAVSGGMIFDPDSPSKRS